MSQSQRLNVEEASDAQEVPRRIAYIHQKTSTQVRRQPERFVMTFPHLIIREVIAFQILSIGVILISLFFDAPLEEIANPIKTPNPAKAPWYFLGLQELLHYYPPIIAGVLIPTLVVIALIVIPYFDINIKREGLWKTRRRTTLIIFAVVWVGFCALFFVTHVYAILIPTLGVGGLMLVPYFVPRETGRRLSERSALGWLTNQSLAVWVMTWFVIVATTLTILGTFFRGPGWSLVLPWR